MCSACSELLEAVKPQGKIEAIQTRTQYDLLDLLLSDIELGFAYVETARTAGDERRAQVSIRKAKQALDEVRLFAQRVRDPEKLTQIERRSSELEDAIRSFSR